MNSKARITADFATPSDVASRLRIPASRVAELRRLLGDVQGTRPKGIIEVGLRRPLARKASSLRTESAAKKK
jgi:hypothetical protein